MSRLPDCIVALLLAFGFCSGTKADCPQGQYRASPGLCCLLCDAGTFKIEDCSIDGGYAHCLSCSDGKYTDGDNQEPRCLTCTECGQHEVIRQDCKATQNRKCVCDVGFYRPENSDSCQEKSHFQASDGAALPIAIGGAVGGVCLLVAAAVACYFLMRKCRRCAIPVSCDIPMEVTENVSASERDNIVNNQAQHESLLRNVVCGNGTASQLVPPSDYSRYYLPVTEEHLVEILKARADSSAVAFVKVMRNAGLPERNIERIQHDNKNVEEQNYKMLYEWLQVMGRKATFSALLKAKDECRFHKLSEDCQKKFDEIIKKYAKNDDDDENG